MGSHVNAAVNSSLPTEGLHEYLQDVVENMKAWYRSNHPPVEGIVGENYERLRYEIDPEEDYVFVDFMVDDDYGDFFLLQDIGILPFSYRWSRFLDILRDYPATRLVIQKYVEIMGGTEIIYLPGSLRHPLTRYGDGLIWYNMSYADLKAELTLNYGEPIQDLHEYIALESERDVCRFYVDDFSRW